MIRILIADDLNTRIIDKLNEIPEFEIIEKIGLTAKQLADELKNAEAVVLRDTTPLTSAMLKGAVSLKIIVRAGSGRDHVDTAMARRKNIEIHNTPLFPTLDAENQERTDRM